MLSFTRASALRLPCAAFFFALLSWLPLSASPAAGPDDLAPARAALEATGMSAVARSAILKRIEAAPERFAKLLAAVEAQKKADPQLFVRVDKTQALAKDFEPADLVSLDGTGLSVSRKGHLLRKSTVEALLVMDKAARAAGVDLLVSSPYRSYAYQVEVFARNVKELGKKEAERVSASPGHSQHQLGSALDFGSIDNSFAETPAGRWLAANARRFGFSLSYPRGLESVTGYARESWHYRYIGVEAAALEGEYFGGVQQYLILFLEKYE